MLDMRASMPLTVCRVHRLPVAEVCPAASRRSFQRQVSNAIRQFCCRTAGNDEFKITNQRTDTRAQLVSIDNAAICRAHLLASRGQREQVVILAEQHSPEFGRTLQQLLVRHAVEAVFLTGHNVRRRDAAVQP